MSDQHKKEKQEGNKFDKIFKENAEKAFLPLVATLLDVELTEYKRIKEKFQTTIEREMDFVFWVKTKDDEEFIIHIEFDQNLNNTMIYRMLEYHGYLTNTYHLPIKHVLIYLGTGTPNVRTMLNEEHIFKGYELINISTLDPKQFIESDIPESVLLALLANWPELNEEVVRLVRNRLWNLSADKKKFYKYFNQMRIMLGLRKASDYLSKIIKDMPLTIDISDDIFFKQGIEKGLKIGLEQGLEQGLEKGLEQGLEQVIINGHLEGISVQLLSKMTGLSESKVEKVIEKHAKK